MYRQHRPSNRLPHSPESNPALVYTGGDQFAALRAITPEKDRDMPVTGFDIEFQRVLEGGRAWGDVGAYEELRGTLRFAVDPEHDSNARITDVELAPRNADGLVEFSADASIILPVDRGKASGRMLLDIVNRGNRLVLRNLNEAPRMAIDESTPVDAPISLGNGFLMEQGYVVVACGWQVDAPPIPALIKMEGPDAVTPDGGPVIDRVYCQLQPAVDTLNLQLSDRNHKPYPAFDMDEADAFVEVRDMPDGPARRLPRDAWRFGRIEDDGTYVADTDYICSEDGFEKGLLYQIVYTGVGARVLGLSFAGLRDCVSWIKYGSDGAKSPAPGTRRAYAYGHSQTGRYLRTYVYNDFNLDEEGRESLDGIISNVAGGMRGEFNQRFGQNSKDRNNMLHQLFPFAPTVTTDVETEETNSLHRRLDERGSSLKVFYTNTSAEYHRLDASLVHTDPDGRQDVDAGPNARVYHFAGTEHGIGTWPPTDNAYSGEGDNRSMNIRNVVDYAPLLRACLLNLDLWAGQGIEPPPSSHGRVADGTAVTTESLKAVFNGIPDSHYPAHHPVPRRREYAAEPGNEHPTQLPPVVGAEFGGLVSAVDADGNELAGVRLPDVSVPLATHTGWTLRHPDIGGDEQPLMFAGATMPFAATKAGRDASGDPRLSVEERYASKDEYLSQVREAAEALVRERYLLDQDIDQTVDQAATMWDWVVDGNVADDK